jgi:hypothetical protein
MTQINTSRYCKHLWEKIRVEYSDKIRIADLEVRVQQLEKLVHYPAATKMKEQAAQAEATQNLYAPLRNDTKAVLDLAAFARRLLDPQDLGHAVTFEVRNAARRALGLPEATIDETLCNR